ncbi:hypothetical protein BJV77DRAFT_992732 [Russula vinacea]|nr:hypothetical protein BJV77DRAFT_992732 [Russula vinacea]
MGTGFFGTQSSFRMTVFRPFPTEINYGESQVSDEDGIQLVRTTGYVTSSSIRRHVDSARSPPQPCPFDPQERAYSWFPSSEATSTHELRGSPEAERLYIDQGENVRASGERDEFRDDDPGPPKATEGVLISGQVQARRLPCTVTQGLGAIAW